MILALFMKSFRFVCVNYDYYLFGFSLSLMNNVFSNELCFWTFKIEDVNYLASFLCWSCQFLLHLITILMQL